MSQNVYLELVRAKVSPADNVYDQGIPVVDGQARPFLVERSWIGAMGHYWEKWSIRKKDGEVVLEGEPIQVFVRGFQSVRTFTDRVDKPFALEPGKYELVFHVDDILMGSAEIEAKSASTAAA